jgi:hypothetical protein
MGKLRLLRRKEKKEAPQEDRQPMQAVPGRKVFIGLPAYNNMRYVPAEVSLMMAQQVFWIKRIEYEFEWETKCCYVSMARNNLISAFMARFTEIIFLDADVGFNPEAFAGLLDCDVDMVAGIYSKKNEDNSNDHWPIILKTTPEGIPIVKDGLILASDLPTGFMKIKRGVIEKMYEAYPELRFLDGNTGRFTYDLFGCGVRDYNPAQGIGRWYGDDYGFCDLWKKIGGEMWVLPNIDFTHTGPHNWKGNYHTYLLSLPKAEDAKPIEKALSIDGWMSYEELKWLYETAKGMNSVAEIGSFKGRSTAALLAGCPGTVTAIDHWKGSPDGNGMMMNVFEVGDLFAEFIKNVGGAPNLKFLKMSSLEAAEQMNGDKQDMVFLDGNHNYEAVKADIEAWLPKTGKILAGHDWNPALWPDVVRAVKDTLGDVEVIGTIWVHRIAEVPLES